MIPATGGPAVVIGVGNVLLRDDGAGVRAVEAMRSVARRDPAALPAGTRIVDGGTLGVDLLDAVDGARSLLLLDAVDLGEPAGTVTVLRGDAILASAGAPVAAGVAGVGGLLSLARLMGRLPGPVALVGIQVDDTSPGIGLSAPVAAALPRAVETACGELRELDGLVGAAPRRPGIGDAEGATA